MRRGHYRPGRPPRYPVGCLRPVSGLTSEYFRRIAFPFTFDCGAIGVEQWQLIRLTRLPLRGQRRDGSSWNLDERTGFPFHFPERQFRETPEADELQTPAQYMKRDEMCQ